MTKFEVDWQSVYYKRETKKAILKQEVNIVQTTNKERPITEVQDKQR